MANIAAELKQFFSQKSLRTFLGAVKPCNKKDTIRVVVTELKLDEHLTAYFKHMDTYYAHDPNKVCKTGDIVLIKELKEKKTKLITHEVMKVIYPLGDTTCPLTGKKVVTVKYGVPRYREDLDKLSKLYGENPTGFKYKDAPARGWQEGKRDFSHLEILPKYHEDDEGPHLADV
ncbi:small ribosomal subunit protein uS17m [Planococcus citri]|uniref:small ribosomal subunit protein uS17m n=1 Tax=Planococcus citri TaxID=170843 RepID=UPI0031F82077